jgi:hypothetical protein
MIVVLEPSIDSSKDRAPVERSKIFMFERMFLDFSFQIYFLDFAKGSHKDWI